MAVVGSVGVAVTNQLVDVTNRRRGLESRPPAPAAQESHEPSPQYGAPGPARRPADRERGKTLTPTRSGASLSKRSSRSQYSQVVTPSSGLSFLSFARRLASSQLLRQVFSSSPRQPFSLWPRLQPELAIPAWAVSACDGGHGAAPGCAQLLLLSASECLYLFGARHRGIPESFWWS